MFLVMQKVNVYVFACRIYSLEENTSFPKVTNLLKKVFEIPLNDYIYLPESGKMYTSYF